MKKVLEKLQPKLAYLTPAVRLWLF